MLDIKQFAKTNQRAMVIGLCFPLVFAIAFGLGSVSKARLTAPEIKIEEAFSPLNNTEKETEVQSDLESKPAPEPVEDDPDCKWLIKGNISSSGERIYHVPGGSFHSRVVPEMCFETEAEAVEQGFRKSAR